MQNRLNHNLHTHTHTQTIMGQEQSYFDDGSLHISEYRVRTDSSNLSTAHASTFGGSSTNHNFESDTANPPSQRRRFKNHILPVPVRARSGTRRRKNYENSHALNLEDLETISKQNTADSQTLNLEYLKPISKQNSEKGLNCVSVGICFIYVYLDI